VVWLVIKGGRRAALEPGFCSVQAVLVDIVGDGRGEHIGYVEAGGQSVSYLGAAYINQGRLDNISLKFFDALPAPEGFEFGEVWWLTAGPVHHRQITFINQLDNSIPERQLINTVSTHEPVD